MPPIDLQCYNRDVRCQPFPNVASLLNGLPLPVSCVGTCCFLIYLFIFDLIDFTLIATSSKKSRKSFFFCFFVDFTRKLSLKRDNSL